VLFVLKCGDGRFVKLCESIKKKEFGREIRRLKFEGTEIESHYHAIIEY